MRVKPQYVVVWSSKSGDFKAQKCPFFALEKSHFDRWHKKKETKKWFSGSEMQKISLPFFVSQNRQKSGFKKYNHFLKKI